jgi:formylglycine-generating enzyme required for sulfatase activity
LLIQVPPAYRSAELRDLLEQATDLRDECDHLQRDIEAAVRTGDTETLPALVNRLRKLKPNNKAIKQLAADLKQYGAAKVIARRKGQRRFLDTAGRVVEPQHIALGIVLVVGLFVGVTVMVKNYLATSGPPIPVPTPDPVQPSPPPVPVAVPRQEPIPAKVVSPAKVPADAPAITPAKPSDPLPQTITSMTSKNDLGPVVPPQVQSPSDSIKMFGSKAGDERSENVLNLKFLWCPPGQFVMGSPATEAGRNRGENQRSVTIERGFWIGQTEVTQAHWRDLMKSEPWKGQSGVKVAPDAVAFCKQLTERERQAQRLPNTWEYALPLDSEWEYACRAGTTTAYFFGGNPQLLIQYDWFDQNAEKRPGQKFAHPVAKRKPNAWGLFDVHGNVAEWIAETNYFGDSRQRTLRGGSWAWPAVYCRSAQAGGNPPDFKRAEAGFRVSLRQPLTADHPSDMTSSDIFADRSPVFFTTGRKGLCHECQIESDGRGVFCGLQSAAEGGTG